MQLLNLVSVLLPGVVANSGKSSVPANAILNSTNGYVRNDSGGYVLRSYT